VSLADHQPDAAARAVAADLLDRVVGDYAATRFNLLGDALFRVVEEDASDLAAALNAVAPREPGEPDPRYVRVLFDLERVPAVGSYLTVVDGGQTSVCCVLVFAGHDAEGPGAPWMLGEALLAVFDLEETERA
jgi:hypothetical protein